MEKALTGARTLGLKVSSTRALIGRVQEGFDIERLRALERNTGLSSERLGRFAAITPRTFTRRQAQGRLTPQESDRVLRASRIFELALDLFDGNADEAREWLQTPAPSLSGNQPIDYASTEVGAREVEQLIGRLRHGVFT
jgi:putative toxin-antitoxin system antitoxin component (TIGR02293 family)